MIIFLYLYVSDGTEPKVVGQSKYVKYTVCMYLVLYMITLQSLYLKPIINHVESYSKYEPDSMLLLYIF